MWPITKFLLKRDGLRTPTAIHGPSGLKFHPPEKANTITDFLENNSHTMTFVTKTMNGEWRLEFNLCSKP
jgi:hypothetical protein